MEVVLKDAEQIYLEGLYNEVSNELHGNILPYWIKHIIDSKNSGFFGMINNDDSVSAYADKGLVMHARFLWCYSAAYRISGNPAYKGIAEHALGFLKNSLADKKYGGYFWSADYKGNVIDDQKMVYGQAFAIYGLTEYYRAFNCTKAYNLALEVFELLEGFARDRKFGGYVESLNRTWLITSDKQLDDTSVPCCKSMNTNLHVLEAYANLYRVGGNSEVKLSLHDQINLLFNEIVDSKTHQQNLYFDMEWNPLTDHVSYGHDIEASWLLWEAISILDDRELKELYRNRIVLMTDRVIAEGLDENYGLNNEKSNCKIDRDKHWWPQAEMMVGLLNVWEITGDNKYLKIIDKVWQFTKKEIISTTGEWYWGKKVDGSLFTAIKGGMWKTPYHNGRLCMEFLERINRYRLFMKEAKKCTL